MKLLFDEHLPRSMIQRVGDVWPGSSHVALLDLSSTGDAVIYAFAADNDFVIVTKDSDFYQLSVINGAPPKVIWLQIGNCSLHDLERLLRRHVLEILAFNADPLEAILIVS